MAKDGEVRRNVEAVLAVAGEKAKGAGAGLGGLVDRLKNSELADNVSTWVSTNANKLPSGEQVARVLGADAIGKVAKDLGVSGKEAADRVAAALPAVIDNISPTGKLPENLDNIGKDLAALLQGPQGPHHRRRRRHRHCRRRGRRRAGRAGQVRQGQGGGETRGQAEGGCEAGGQEAGREEAGGRQTQGSGQEVGRGLGRLPVPDARAGRRRRHRTGLGALSRRPAKQGRPPGRQRHRRRLLRAQGRRAAADQR